jgi:type I restriction-modification system DNA methylase subunit/vacuolar-type H+-ATPase subunit H
MNFTQIEINIQNLIKKFNKETFIFDLLLAYGSPKSTITRLKKGSLNMSKNEGELSWKKKVFFKEEYESDLHLTISELADKITHNERFVIVTDYKTLLAIDTKTKDKLDCSLTDLPKHFDFFLPWAGMEKAQHTNENPADVKAAEKMAKLFDVIKKDNPDDSPEFIHGLNVFLSRLLFCYFAEDTQIFEDCQFTNSIDSHTQTDGSDLNLYLDKLFTILNTPEKERENLPEYLKGFPFVNGGLFQDSIPSPKFSRSSRAALLNAGDQDWSAINPDIFGSMFQAVISDEQRGSLGQHYTSVPNIMKVIEPLFLNDLYEELEKSRNSKNKLFSLLNRIYKLKIFDPACGSGNFLIIAYKELRLLEIEIIKTMNKVEKGQASVPYSNIRLSQFYGIEIDDFAGEIAKLALWLAEHQMNVQFYKEFGKTNPTLPLSQAGHIIQGNATRLNWEEVCPKKEGDEIYILGNPPYLGARLQDKYQKQDMAFVFKHISGFNNLDYIAAWFYKGANYIYKHNAKLAIVSTNSICQGEQVSILWPNILNKNIEIDFAVRPFLWSNSAKNKAAVYCSIISIRNNSLKPKYIFDKNRRINANHINSYLLDFRDVYVYKRSTTLSDLPNMVFGSMANDAGNLIISKDEMKKIIQNNPSTVKFFKKLVGAVEFTNNTHRWCLWIEDNFLKEAMQYPEIRKKIEAVKVSRSKSKRIATHKLAERPHAFGEIRHQKGNAILIPRVTSERRDYLQCGFYDDSTIITDRASVIYRAEPYIFGILSSKIHTLWTKTVSGRLKMDINYAVSITYNNYPFPNISDKYKTEITQSVLRILKEREIHSDKTIAELYDPDKMPEGLREAHRQNDIIIEKCYRSTPFNSDEERLEYLFKLYEKMIAEEQSKINLSAKEKNNPKKKK